MWTHLQRRRFLAAAMLLAVVGGNLLASEREVADIALPDDRPGNWTLHFRYKEPRIITVNVPGKGPQQMWYMWFQVYNTSGEPQNFVPEFELVTRNPNTTHLDEPQPSALEAIQKIENPLGEENTPDPLKIRSTVSIAKKPIPPTKKDSVPRTVTGVAIWANMGDKAPKANKFSVFVTGLSDGLATETLPDGQKIIKRKTLQLDFLRPTDDNRTAITDIRLDPNVSMPEKWIYRAASTIPPIQKKDPEKKND